MNDFHVLLSSDLDYDKVVAEIYVGDKYVGLINQDDPQNLRFEFPIECDQSVATSEVPVTILLQALQVALEKLGYDLSSFSQGRSPS
jgi:hypothetical protein